MTTWIQKASLCASLLISSVTAHADLTLDFGLYTSDRPSVLMQTFSPILDALESKLSTQLGEPVTINLRVATTYEQGLQQLTNGEVDFARFGPASYVAAKEENSDISLLAMESKEGKKIFYGIICVSVDSAVAHVDQLRGTSFAFGNQRSTIGRYLSQQYLMEHGIFASSLSEYRYLSRHDHVGMAVAAGTYDAGALKENTFNMLVEKGVGIREIARFPNVTKPWIARAGLPENIRLALTDALLFINRGFVPALDQDFQQIREAISTNDQFFENPSHP